MERLDPFPGPTSQEEGPTMQCPDHDEVSVGTCQTCGREVCEVCLEEVESPEDFECPDCGEFGVAMYDDEYMGEEEEEEGRGFDL
jgi:predicted RNA-binding Zn-ribbon protein involved in translation (DUF1610 family)